MVDAWTYLFGQKRGQGWVRTSAIITEGDTRLLFQITTNHHYVSSLLLNKCGYARWCGKGEAVRLPPIPIKRGNVVARRLLAREKTISPAMLSPASCPPAP